MAEELLAEMEIVTEVLEGNEELKPLAIHNLDGSQPQSESIFRQTLLQFQKDNYLCDAVLVGEDGQQPVHSVVMAAVSPLFKSLFQTHHDAVVLQGVKLYLLKILIHFAYTGEMLVPEAYSTSEQFSIIISFLDQLGISFPAEMIRIDNSQDDASGDLNISCCESDTNAVEEVLHIVNCNPERAEIPSQKRFKKKLTKKERLKVNMKSRQKAAKYGTKSSDETTEPKVKVEPAGEDECTTPAELTLCGVCGETFDSAQSFSTHMTSMHNAPDVSSNTVDGREEQILTQMRSIDHNSGGGSGSILSNSSGLNKTFKTASHHFNKTKTKASSSTVENNENESDFVVVPVNPPVPLVRIKRSVNLCELCGMVYDTSKALNNHKVVHYSDTNPFECSECGQQFSYKHGLTKHIAMEHRGERHLCQFCGEGYRNTESLRDHLLQNHPDLVANDPRIKPYECAQCGEKFVKQKRYYDHMNRKHPKPNAVTEFTCKICDRQYSTKESLRFHTYLKHRSAGDLFICGDCGHRFASEAMLKRHQVRHASTQPFCCQFCGHHYQFKKLLDTHVCSRKTLASTVQQDT